MAINLLKSKLIAAKKAALEKEALSAAGKAAGVPSSQVKGQTPSPPPSHPVSDEHASKIYPRLDRQQAAAFLTSHGYKITANRLAKLAASKEGPEYRRWGKSVYYYLDALLKWAEAREEIVVPYGGASHKQ